MDKFPYYDVNEQGILSFPFYEVKEKGIVKIERSLILNEVARRGIKITPFPIDGHGYFLLENEGHKEIVGFLNTSALGFIAGKVTKDKHKTKWLLKQAGISVPEGEVFSLDQREDLLKYSNGKELVTVKPNEGSQGTNVYAGISGNDVLNAADVIWGTREKRVIVEDYFEGNEYRVFATRNGFVGVAQRVPAAVVGDGSLTIEELVERDNVIRGPGTGRPLIPIDKVVQQYLGEKGLDVKYIPKLDEQIRLRSASNLSKGGRVVCYDNSEVDPKVKEIAMDTLEAVPGMAYAGIDLMCEDIREFNDYVIIEINKSAGMTNHHLPHIGTPQNAAGALIDQIFPETI